MEDIEQPPVERTSHPRTSQACQRCRSLKTRCLPSEQTGTCQRCLIARRECTWAEAPRKTKRARGPSRISQVEQKIDGLVATLSIPDAPRPTSEHRPSDPPSEAGSTQRPLAPGSWIPIPPSFEQQEPHVDQDTELDKRYAEKLQVIHNFGDEPDITKPPGTLFNGPSRKEKPIEGQLVEGLLMSGEADTFLSEYRNMAESFPFVPIPTYTSARELSTTKPMTLLAILTVASWKNNKVQRSLDKKYREELAERTIIHPRRTNSLFQSMIVYLSWYHFVFSHKTQQIYQLLQLAIGIALDIGLHQESKPFLAIPGRTKPPILPPEEQRERQRGILGVYYLSSAFSISLMKPNLLKYTDYMGKCAHNLRYDPEFPSDGIISRLVSLRRIDDQINDTFNTEEASELPVADSRIAMNLRFMENQLEEWRRENNNLNPNRALELSHAFTDMQLHAIALRPAQPVAQPFGQNATQVSALVCTLEAGKRFFDTLLAIPAAEYHFLSMPDWMRVPHVVITMSRLCIPSELHTTIQWDAQAAQDRVRVDLYLESLCYRMQGLSTYDKVKQPHTDFWRVMHLIMDLTRTWYTRKIRGQNAPPSSSRDTPDNLPTPDTMQNYNPAGTGMLGTSEMSSTGAPADAPFGLSMGASSGPADPFAFMREMDFDMDQFLDMGIWTNDSYQSMGFGGASMGF